MNALIIKLILLLQKHKLKSPELLIHSLTPSTKECFMYYGIVSTETAFFPLNFDWTYFEQFLMSSFLCFRSSKAHFELTSFPAFGFAAGKTGIDYKHIATYRSSG